MVSSTPLRRTSRPTVTSRGRAARGNAVPFGVNPAVSTPHGTTRIRCRGAPRRASSKTSSLHVATIRSTAWATARSAATRPSGLVSAWPWCRRLTLPSAWKVCTVGTPLASAAVSTARPDIQ